MRGRHLWRAALTVVAAVALAGCLEGDAHTQVGADGAATTSMVLELDLELLDEIFSGLAESFDDEGPEQPSIAEQARESLDELEADLAALYERRPDLRDRLRLSASFDDGTLRTEIDARTETVEELATLYDNLLGSGSRGLEEIYELDPGMVSGATSEVGGGTGFFESFSIELDGEFRFEAVPIAGGDLDDDFEVDLGAFPGLRPEIELSIRAPGEVVDTNGTADGRTVTWTLDGSETEPLRLVSGVDPSATAGGLGGDGGGFPVALVVSVLVLALLVGGFLALVRRSAGENPPTTGPDEAPPRPPSPPGPPTAPPAG